MTAFDDESLVRRFLLCNVSQNQCEQIEERLFTEERFCDLVDAVEEELIDEYVQGKLAAQDIERFEQHFLITPDRRERLEFARAFQYSLTPALPSASALNKAPKHTLGFWARMFRPPTLAVSFALGVLLLTAVAILLFGIYKRGRQELVTIPATPSPSADADKEKQIARNEENNNAATPSKVSSPTSLNVNQPGDNGVNGTGKPQKSKPQTGVVTEFAIVLTPGVMRSEGEGIKQFWLPIKTKRIRLGLILEDEVAAAREHLKAELQNGDGQTLLSFGKVNSSFSRNNHLNLVLPKDRLTAGDYQVVLQTSSTDGSSEILARYYFRVREASRQKEPD
jgi:hypothetical protein